eukprot:TRINITY_DN61583_c0_g1_i1.p1 TRINITY_DN61583_c0_g1~~TRINITY_DN61583_c0_g1_i1.p1  ORF type:complete len:700 (-),score=91.10 TRINITY_DN61583_c0_g1_i1:57-2120(-)
MAACDAALARVESVAPPVPLPRAPFNNGAIIAAFRKNHRLQKALQDPAKCGILVADLVTLFNTIKVDLEAYCAAHSVGNERHVHLCRTTPCTFDHVGVQHRCMPEEPLCETTSPLDPNMSTVVSRYIKPWTKQCGLSYAGALIASSAGLSRIEKTSGEDDGARCAQDFISHNWREHFADFVRTAKGAMSEQTVVWVCAFAINQNSDISDALGTDLTTVPFARALKAAARVIVFMDGSASTLTRVWCVFEAYLATQESNIEFHVSLPDNTKAADWTGVSRKLEHLDVRFCEASNEQDRKRIMSYVSGLEDELNATVHRQISNACRDARTLDAARRGDLEALESCDPVICGDVGCTTSLHYSALAGHTEVLSYLLRSQANLEARNKDGDEAVHFASRGGQLGSLATLLDARASVESRSSGSGATPLHRAAEHDQVCIFETLLSMGASLVALDDVSATPLHYAARAGNEASARALIDLGAHVDARTVGGEVPLHWAAAGGHVATLMVLLEGSGCPQNIESKSVFGWTPLHSAARWGHSSILLALADQTADVNGRDAKNSTPLHLAASHGQKEACETLLKLGARVNRKTDSGNGSRVALHLAAQNGHVDTVTILVEGGAPVDSADVDGWTPLHLAGWNAELEVVKRLLKLRASQNSKTLAGQTPLSLAEKKHTHDALFKLLAPEKKIEGSV